MKAQKVFCNLRFTNTALNNYPWILTNFNGNFLTKTKFHKTVAQKGLSIGCVNHSQFTGLFTQPIFLTWETFPEKQILFCSAEPKRGVQTRRRRVGVQQSCCHPRFDRFDGVAGSEGFGPWPVMSLGKHILNTVIISNSLKCDLNHC